MLLAAAGLAGIYLFLRRGIDRRAGVYGVVLLAAMPLFFLAADGGAIGPMAATMIALAGLHLGALDDGLPRWQRGLALSAAVAAVAAVAASAGAAPIVARSGDIAEVASPPLVGVGVSAGLLGRRRTSLLLLALGASVAAPAIASAVALALARTAAATTFDTTAEHVIYALAPLSPLAPFAIARRPRSTAQLSACAAAGTALLLHAGVGVLGDSEATFVSAPLVAAAIGAMLRELDDEERSATLLAAAIFATGALFVRDIALAPERMLLGSGVFVASEAGAAPELAGAAGAMRIAVWIVVGGAVCALLASNAMLAIRRTFLRRGAMLATAGAAAGVLSCGYAWPKAIAAVSPRAALDAYDARRAAADRLALLHLEGGDRRGAVRAPDPRSAARWLAEGEAEGGRRFLALPARDLGALNAAFRREHDANVPIVAGERAAFLLATSRLAPGETSTNPLDRIVLGAAPPGLRAPRAAIGSSLDLVGWELDEPGDEREVRVVLRARADAVLSGYCTFLHVDHAPTRFDVEHTSHTYPFADWADGDVVVDAFRLALPPRFGPGSYRVYWGVGVMPCHDDRRMHVTSGPHDSHDRVLLGTLEVR